jgi:hypothetical protein
MEVMVQKGTAASPARVNVLTLEHGLTRSESAIVAYEHGARLATLSEFIRELRLDQTLFERMRGKWFWSGDNPGTEFKGLCVIGYEMGTLLPISDVPMTEAEWYRLPRSSRAEVYGGCGHLALSISGYGHRRLLVDANVRRSLPSQWLVLVPLETESRKSWSVDTSHLLRTSMQTSAH